MKNIIIFYILIFSNIMSFAQIEPKIISVEKFEKYDSLQTGFLNNAYLYVLENDKVKSLVKLNSNDTYVSYFIHGNILTIHFKNQSGSKDIVSYNLGTIKRRFYETGNYDDYIISSTYGLYNSFLFPIVINDDSRITIYTSEQILFFTDQHLQTF